MDTRYTPEQAELRRTARRMARELGPRSVADLDDGKRARRLAEAVREAGWLELRQDAGGGAPWASGVEAAVLADALGEAVADVPFAGPVLADELARRAGASARDGADLTRTIRELPAGAPLLAVPGQSQLLTRADLDSWATLGLALTSADLVGLMRGVLDLTVAYAQERRQYGVPIGTFQAVQHLLADARCLMEGAFSATLYPSWGVDNLDADEARTAGRVAKAYSARAARTVCETAVQVHGGMGNTWDCIVHVYLRRALLSSRWFGDDGEQLRQLQRTRLGVADGLS